jgi:hypothetical protein
MWLAPSTRSVSLSSWSEPPAKAAPRPQGAEGNERRKLRIRVGAWEELDALKRALVGTGRYSPGSNSVSGFASIEGETPNSARYAQGKHVMKKTGNMASVQGQFGHKNAAYSIKYHVSLRKNCTM